MRFSFQFIWFFSVGCCCCWWFFAFICFNFIITCILLSRFFALWICWKYAFCMWSTPHNVESLHFHVIGTTQSPNKLKCICVCVYSRLKSRKLLVSVNLTSILSCWWPSGRTVVLQPNFCMLDENLFILMQGVFRLSHLCIADLCKCSPWHPLRELPRIVNMRTSITICCWKWEPNGNWIPNLGFHILLPGHICRQNYSNSQANQHPIRHWLLKKSLCMLRIA